MKKRNKKITADNGISLHCHINSNERIWGSVLNDIMLIVLTFITVVGAIMTFVTILELQIMEQVVIGLLAVFSIAFGLLFKFIKKRRYLIFVGLAALAGLCLLIFWDELSKGFVLLYDQARVYICKVMRWDDVVPTYEWEPAYYNLTNFAMSFLAAVLSCFISYFIAVKPSFIAIFLLTFPFFEVGAVFGAAPKLLYFSMMVASWAATLTISRVSNSKIKEKKAGKKSKKKKIESAKGKFAASAVVIALATMCLFVFASQFLSAIDFSRSKDVDKLRTETKNYADNILDYITGKDHDGSLKEGKLLEVDDRDIIDRHYFTIQTSILWTNANFRLKGYTATTYNNNRWEQISNYDEYSDLFDRIKEKGYNFGAVNGTLLETYQGRFEYEYSKLHFYDFRRAKNYVYQTYCPIVEKDQAPYKNDLGLAAKNKYDYTYTSYLGDMHMYDITKSELYKDAEFSKLWKEYGEFVKAEYSASYVADSVRELVDSFGAESRNQLIDKVRTYLEENTEYSHKFNKCPKNKDFVEYFLFDEMRGYSTHYATAAAVMLQSQGYPARYVEGYFLPKSVVNSSFIDEEGNLVIDVTDTYAHAWIEIYDSTYGWIPVEVTPGYWSGMFQEELESQINDKPTDSEQQQTKPNKNPNKDDKDDTKLDPNSSNVDNNLGNQFVGGMGGISGGRALTPAEIAVIVVIAVIIFAIIAWILFHYIYALVRKKKLHSDNTNKIINAAYKYFIKLASYEGIDCKNIYSYMAFADRCSENSRHLDKKQNAKFFAILLKNAFSESGASIEEAKLCAEYVIRYSQVIYKDLSAYKKFVFKMIKQL